MTQETREGVHPPGSARSVAEDRRGEGLAWQVSVWNQMAPVYQREIDLRFVPVVEGVLARADLRSGQAVVDLGTGTGAVAFAASAQVGASGRVTAVDISPEMLETARAGSVARALTNVDFVEGRGEAIPVPSDSQDAVLASLSLMYVIERAAAAKEVARVLRPGCRFVGAVWAGTEQADIVQFQQLAGSFAPKPPVEGVGPGALADPAHFLGQLSDVGLEARVEMETTGFHFANFDAAWDALAAVTTAALDPAIQDQARSAVRARMWPGGDGLREFRNRTQFIIATRPI